jgi:hypothetical protein
VVHCFGEFFFDLRKPKSWIFYFFGVKKKVWPGTDSKKNLSVQMPFNYGAMYPGPWDCSADPFAYTQACAPVGSGPCNNSSGYNIHYVHNVTLNGVAGQTVPVGSSSKTHAVLAGPIVVVGSTGYTPQTFVLQIPINMSNVPCACVSKISGAVVVRTSKLAFTGHVTPGGSTTVLEIPLSTSTLPTAELWDIYIQFEV